MTKLNVRNSTCLLWLALAALSASAYADSLTLTLDNASQSVVQGGSVTFTGDLSITGTGVSDTFINGDEFPALVGFIWIGSVDYNPSDPTQVVVDDTDFVLSVPLCMNPTGSAVDSFDCSGSAPASITAMDLFTVSAGSGAAPGLYTGTFDIAGGGINDSNVLASADFEVDVTALESGPLSTPEPSTLMLFALGLVAGARKHFRARGK